MLSAGTAGAVHTFRAGRDRLVAKVGTNLTIEGEMLRYLARSTDVAVPDVVYRDDELLVMTHIDHDGLGNADEECANVLSTLHRITAPTFGFEFDTLIGGLHQPNPSYESWVDFFGEERLLHMTTMAVAEGRLEPRFIARVEQLISKLTDLIDEPARPSLLHGDLWGGNVLINSGKLAALIDPALYFGHYEIEIAFIGMFSTFGKRFYESYEHPLDRDFFDTRRDLYNLYPLLVHVTLFGGGYRGAVEQTLSRFGC